MRRRDGNVWQIKKGQKNAGTEKGRIQKYKEHYGIRYSDAYEVYGLTRTGCCGCSISHKAEADLAKIAPYEPNVVKAAYNIFGASYAYRRQYNEYKAKRMAEDKAKMSDGSIQTSLL